MCFVQALPTQFHNVSARATLVRHAINTNQLLVVSKIQKCLFYDSSVFYFTCGKIHKSEIFVT